MSSPSLDWLDSIIGAIISVFVTVGTMVGWFISRLSLVNARIDVVTALVNKQNERTAVQEERHIENQRRLSNIEDQNMCQLQQNEDQSKLLTQILSAVNRA